MSSFTKGYLKEYAYTYDFSEDLDGWSAIDTDKDDNTWKHENAMAVTNGSDEWLISPEKNLDKILKNFNELKNLTPKELNIYSYKYILFYIFIKY